jgi:hypothetical protein
MLEEGRVLLVKGPVRERGSESELLAEELVPLEKATEDLVSGIDLSLPSDLATQEILRLRDCLIEHRGEVPVSIQMALGDRVVTILPEERFRVAAVPEALASVEEIVGAGNIHKRYRLSPE